MAHAAPTSPDLAHHVTPAGRTTIQHPPVTPGKVAMWLFLATEIMFFTGLIGSYIVLRAGSPPTAYSNLFPPATNLEALANTKGVRLESVGPDREKVAEIVGAHMTLDRMQNAELIREMAAIEALKLAPAEAAKRKEEATREFKHHQVEHLLDSLPHGVAFGVTDAAARKLHDELARAGAVVKIEPLVTHHWPKPYDSESNPLSIDLTAFNTFILICSSVTMVLALSAFQRDDRRKGSLFLLATVLIGSCFLGVQVYEYYQLMFGHHYPPGISATGHFRPDVSLFASCFFTMTGFHGAHVTGGVIMLAIIFLQSLRGIYTRHNFISVELAGLYWHFVDLVWIILFTVVYLI